MGMSKQRVSQIKDRAYAEWGNVPKRTAAEQLQTARDAYQAAKNAQEVRCERYAMGYASEERSFYGDTDAPQSDEAEQRVTWAGMYEGQQRQADNQT